MGTLSDKKDVGALIDAETGISPTAAAAGASPVAGTGFAKDERLSGVVHAMVGTVTGSPSSFSVTYTIEHSADDGDTDAYTEYDSSYSLELTEADMAGEIDVNLAGAKKYVRVVATLSFTDGSSPTANVAATLVTAGADTVAI